MNGVVTNGVVTKGMGRGGVRKGAGRKPSLNPATKLATVKMTREQHKAFLQLGGSKWVKKNINEYLGES